MEDKREHRQRMDGGSKKESEDSDHLRLKYFSSSEKKSAEAESSSRHASKDSHGHWKRHSTAEQRCPTLLSEARPSEASLRARSSFSPAQRLLYSINMHFPGRDLRFIEEVAEEIQQHSINSSVKEMWGRSVDRLATFENTLRRMTKELLYLMELEESRIIDDALRKFQTEIVTETKTSRDQLKKTAIKPCIRVDGIEAYSHGERLVERLGELLAEKYRRDIIIEVDNAKTKEDVKEIILKLSTFLRGDMEMRYKETRESINSAIHFFAAQIISEAKEYQKLTGFMTAMKQMIDEMISDSSGDTTSAIYAMSKSILADFNLSNDKLTSEINNDITNMLEAVNEVKSKFPEKTQKKITEFEKAVENLY